ncbi:hypothetical protein [Entomomonas asaccharolytica]|uniref:Uncharacterized protein n=1 Tax=Entomomonas asaccharolytica TaxID=2785331 RepID=A0A974NCR4_9GAMM|nr:hypothetical protein [Entomomonas asaccharolytica]QQP84341.1 hypothetical protein JHT90_07840 [Entomomonas asaccharolytica]
MLDILSKLKNTFKKNNSYQTNLQRELPKQEMPVNDEMRIKQKVILTIKQIREDYPVSVRQRKNVYHYLNKKLGLDIAMYDYDDTGENTILSLDPSGTQQGEYNYIVEKYATALKNKKD